MRYQGGKSKLARWIVDAIRADLGDRTIAEIVEPFMGGGAVTLALRGAFPQARIYATDAMSGLAEMHTAVVDGWVLDVVPIEEHAKVARRFRAGEACTSAREVALLTACSWGGQPGSGAARPWHSTLLQFSTWCHRWRTAFYGTSYKFEARDYRDALATARAGDLVYLDPPYANTEAYPQAPRFDSAEFWRRAHECAARGAHVYVSELTAPDSVARIIAERTRVRHMNRAHPAILVERLYAINP